MVGVATEAVDGGGVVVCATTEAANSSTAVETAERTEKDMVGCAWTVEPDG